MRKYVDEDGITRYEYTEEEKKQREISLKENEQYVFKTRDPWCGQGTVDGSSTYGKFGNGGQS